MKKIVVVLVSFVVAVLVGVGNAFAQDNIPHPPLGHEWKLVGRRPDGSTLYVNTKKITYSPEGIVKVWTLFVPRGEFRREQVHLLEKKLLSEGKDPNNAERLWYHMSLYKVNCKNHQIATLEEIDYSFVQAPLDDESYQHEEWSDIPPGTADEIVEKYACKKYK